MNVTLGTDTGIVETTFKTYGVAARVQIYWGNNPQTNLKCDSLFIRDNLYSDLDSSVFLNNIINTPSLITHEWNSDCVSYLDELNTDWFDITGQVDVDFNLDGDITPDGYTRSQSTLSNTGQRGVDLTYPNGSVPASHGEIKLKFNKNVAGVTDVKIIVSTDALSQTTAEGRYWELEIPCINDCGELTQLLWQELPPCGEPTDNHRFTVTWDGTGHPVGLNTPYYYVIPPHSNVIGGPTSTDDIEFSEIYHLEINEIVSDPLNMWSNESLSDVSQLNWYSSSIAGVYNGNYEWWAKLRHYATIPSDGNYTFEFKLSMAPWYGDQWNLNQEGWIRPFVRVSGSTVTNHYGYFPESGQGQNYNNTQYILLPALIYPYTEYQEQNLPDYWTSNVYTFNISVDLMAGDTVGFGYDRRDGESYENGSSTSMAFSKQA